jgi:hypothetical protein
METIIKIDIAKMKADIKAKVEEQRFLKNQRKTVYIVGDRIIPANEAWYKHYTNREDLRILYAAYGLARGKCFSQIENHYSEAEHPLKKYQRSIDRITEKYEVLEEVEVLK